MAVGKITPGHSDMRLRLHVYGQPGTFASLLSGEASTIDREWDSQELAEKMMGSIGSAHAAYSRAFHQARPGIAPAV